MACIDYSALTAGEIQQFNAFMPVKIAFACLLVCAKFQRIVAVGQRRLEFVDAFHVVLLRTWVNIYYTNNPLSVNKLLIYYTFYLLCNTNLQKYDTFFLALMTG